MLHSFDVELIEEQGTKAVALIRRMVNSRVLDRHGLALKNEADAILREHDAALARLNNPKVYP